jgi:hypothetical protein
VIRDKHEIEKIVKEEKPRREEKQAREEEEAPKM